MWDIGGQKTIRPYWRNYYDSTDALVYVVDSGDSNRIDECRAELESLLAEPQLAGVPLLLFANKQDLLSALDPAEITSALGLEKLTDRSFQICACSAKTGEGLTEGMEWMVSRVRFYWDDMMIYSARVVVRRGCCVELSRVLMNRWRR